jgi:hypothetical protein
MWWGICLRERTRIVPTPVTPNVQLHPSRIASLVTCHAFTGTAVGRDPPLPRSFLAHHSQRPPLPFAPHSPFILDAASPTNVSRLSLPSPPHPNRAMSQRHLARSVVACIRGHGRSSADAGLGLIGLANSNMV